MNIDELLPNSDGYSDLVVTLTSHIDQGYFSETWLKKFIFELRMLDHNIFEWLQGLIVASAGDFSFEKNFTYLEYSKQYPNVKKNGKYIPSRDFVIPKTLYELSNLSYLKLVSITKKIEKAIPIVYIDEIIGDLRNLLRLEIQLPLLESLPNSIGKLINLKYLIIKNCRIVKLPETISRLKNLKMINIVNTPVDSIHTDILPVTLKTLVIDKTNIKIISDNILRLTRLTDLWLMNGKIEISNNVFRIKNLQTLVIYNCGLQNITSKDIQLPKITRIYLNNNFLSQLPNLLHLINLRVLDISSNNFSIIPEYIAHSDLLELNISDNPIQQFPYWILSRCKLIVRIDSDFQKKFHHLIFLSRVKFVLDH